MINIFKRWLSHSKEQDIDDSMNPWAGLASYEDPETAERKLKFCGRDDDSYDLARLIMGNVFVTLYGKSGIGKTSLLNAGVFPELREEHYTPVSIRLGMRDEEHPQSYQAIIVKAVERVVKKVETVNVIDEQKDQQSVDYLWNYFSRHRFYDKYDRPTIPVIVFDQFEEVFRGHRDEAEIMLRQMDYLNDKDHTLDYCEVDDQPYRYEQNFRFVVSIREDDLYRLEDSIDNCYLPALKRCRYRLRSLSESGANDVILIPGHDYFEEKEKEIITKIIVSVSKDSEENNINTNTLSLLCSRIYVSYKRNGRKKLTEEFVRKFVQENPFESFYFEVTKNLSEKEKKYIENNFVDSSERRNSVSDADFKKNLPNGQYLSKGSTKIFQRFSISSDSNNERYELIHDSFCKTLVRHKNLRMRNLSENISLFLSYIFIFALGYFTIPIACEYKDEWWSVFIFSPFLLLFILPIVTVGLIRNDVQIKLSLSGCLTSLLPIVSIRSFWRITESSHYFSFIFIYSLSALLFLFFVYSVFVGYRKFDIMPHIFQRSTHLDSEINYSYLDLFVSPANRQWLLISTITLAVISLSNLVEPVFNIGRLLLILSLFIFSWFAINQTRHIYTIGGYLLYSSLVLFTLNVGFSNVFCSAIVFLFLLLGWLPLWYYVMPAISELAGEEGNWGCGTLICFILVLNTYDLIGQLSLLRVPVLPLLLQTLFIITIFDLYIYNYFEKDKRFISITLVSSIELLLCILLSFRW